MANPGFDKWQAFGTAQAIAGPLRLVTLSTLIDKKVWLRLMMTKLAPHIPFLSKEIPRLRIRINRLLLEAMLSWSPSLEIINIILIVEIGNVFTFYYWLRRLIIGRLVKVRVPEVFQLVRVLDLLGWCDMQYAAVSGLITSRVATTTNRQLIKPMLVLLRIWFLLVEVS